MENIITCKFTANELEVLYYAAGERADELLAEIESPSIRPEYREQLLNQCKFIQKLKVSIRLVLQGQPMSPQDIFTKNGDSIVGRFTDSEAEEICYAITECEGALHAGSREPSISPACRKILDRHHKIAHGLMVRLDLSIEEQSPPPAPIEPFPTNIMDDIYSFVSRGLGYLP